MTGLAAIAAIVAIAAVVAVVAAVAAVADVLCEDSRYMAGFLHTEQRTVLGPAG